MSDLFKVKGVGGLVESLLGDAADGFQAGFVLELIDSRKKDPVLTHVFVLNPTRYDLSEPLQADLTAGEDGTVIAEESGIVMREITLEGTFGLKKRAARTFDGAPRGGELSGTEHHRILRNLFRTYSDLKKNPTSSPFLSLVFHALKDDDHFLVIPRSIDSPRSASGNRVHRLYRIKLTAIAGPKYGVPKAGKDKEGGFFDAVGDLSKGLHDARAAFADATADLERMRRKVANIDALMIQTAGVITAIGNFVRGVKALFITKPVQLVLAISAQLERSADEIEAIGALNPDQNPQDRDFVIALRNIQAAFDRVAQYPEVFASPNALSNLTNNLTGVGAPAASVKGWFSGERRLTQNDLDENLAGASAGSRTRVAQGSGQEGGLVLGGFRGVTEWVVRRSDSIQSIGNETGAVPEAIILLNDLRYPYISEGGGPGIAKPGDKLLVPTADGDASGGSPDPSAGYYTAEDVFYGVDAALDTQLLDKTDVLDLLVDEAHGAEDVAITRSVANVVQGLTITLNTELGETSHLPDIGVRRTVGLRGTLQHTLLSAIRLREGVLADDRVASIDSISTVLENDVLAQEIVPRLVSGASLTLSIPFGKASGLGSNRIR